MNQITSTSIDNGRRLPVACPFYTGMAGVRAGDTGGEFAFSGEQPFGSERDVGTVDGRAVQITGYRKSAVATGMIVARFTYVEAAA